MNQPLTEEQDLSFFEAFFALARSGNRGAEFSAVFQELAPVVRNRVERV